MESVRDNPVTIAKSANATGKSQPIDTPVLTPYGYVPIGTIKEGDQVFGDDGNPHTVIGVFPQGNQPTYRVYLNDDSSTLCSKDHLWDVRTSSGKNRETDYETMTTADVSKILHRFVHIPMCKPVEFQSRPLAIDPYVVGVLLGDGEMGQYIRFTSEDDFIVKEVQARIGKQANVVKYNSKLKYGITTTPGKPNPILTAAQKIGMIGCGALEKKIPDDYLYSDIDSRKALLAGLLDTDGYIDRNSCVSFTTISPQLADGVVFIVNSLGGTAKIRTKKTSYKDFEGKKVSGQLSYNVWIKISECPFFLPRKRARWRDPETMQKQAHRLIKKIEYVGEMQSVCISLDYEKKLYLTNNFIVTHNSHGAARIATWFYKCFPGSQVYTAAAPPERNLEKILWGEIGALVDKHPGIFEDDRITRDLNIQRSPLSFLTGVAIPMSGTPEQRQAKFSGKHAPYLLFIVDEGDAVPPEVYKGIESCMSGGFARLLIMFNPRGEYGPVAQMEKKKLGNIISLSAFNHPNVITGDEQIPGAVNRETTVRRVNEWTRPLAPDEKPDAECFEVPEYLVGTTATSLAGTVFEPLPAGWRKVENPAFFYMVLGLYPPQAETQLISRAWIDAAISRWLTYVATYGEKPPVDRAVAGLDVAEYGKDWNVLTYRFGGWVAKPERWQGLDADATALRCFDQVTRDGWRVKVLVDATGIGSGVAPRITRASASRPDRSYVQAESVKVASAPTYDTELGVFFMLRDQLWWSCREWLRDEPNHPSYAMIPPDDDLTEELSAPLYSVRGGKVRITDKDTMREMLGRSPDKADSLCLTFAGSQQGTSLQVGRNPLAGYRG